MSVEHEDARIGTRELSRFIGRSLRSTYALLPEMRRAGVVFRAAGEWGPKKRNHWFPGEVRRFMAARFK